MELAAVEQPSAIHDVKHKLLEDLEPAFFRPPPRKGK